MLPAIRIGGGGCCGISSEISLQRLQDIGKAENLKEAGNLISFCEWIKNLFCGTKQKEAQRLLYQLIHPDKPENPGFHSQGIKEQLHTCFRQLQALCSPGYQDGFSCQCYPDGTFDLTIHDGNRPVFKAKLYTAPSTEKGYEGWYQRWYQIEIGGIPYTPAINREASLFSKYVHEEAGERTWLLSMDSL